MEHTFLFEEGGWEAEGTYLPAEGPPIPARGRTEIIHGDDVWINDGRLVIGEGEARREIRSTYRIRPFPAGARSTSWVSENPALGELRGTFAVVGDTILSVYRAADGAALGSESLRRVDADIYENRGVLRVEDGGVSTWAVRLTRVEGGGP